MEAPTAMPLLSAKSVEICLIWSRAGWSAAREEAREMDDDRKKRSDQEKDSDACRQHREDLLDEALEETFPASDPPAVTRPPAKDC